MTTSAPTRPRPSFPRRKLALAVLCALACRPGATTESIPPAADPSARGHGPAPIVPPSDASFTYPAATRGDVADVYHGVKIADPYRWLEDMDSPQTRAWIEAENALTDAHLEGIAARPKLLARLEQLWNYERWGVPTRQAGQLVVARNDGLQNQSPIYVLDDKGSERLLLDPNTLSDDGTVALAGQAFSHDGKRMAYGTSASGSDWQVWRVRDVATGTDTSDELQWIKFASPAWTKDGKGLFYPRYAEPKAGAALSGENYDQKVYFHRLGTPQSADTLVYARADQPKWGYDTEVSDDGRWLVMTVRIGTDPKNTVLLQDLRKPAKGRPTIELLTGFTAKWEFVGSDGDTLWFRTDEGAPRSKLVAIDVRKPSVHRDVIAESLRTLQTVHLVGDRFVASYLDNAQSRVAIHRVDGSLERELELPGIGTVAGFGGKRSDRETYFSFTGFATPTEVWRLDPTTGATTPWRKPKVAFDPADYVTEQVFYKSADGTTIPMFVSHRRGLEKNGNNPTYLFGYGGFDISLTPSFSVPNLVWMEQGGIYAVPNLRGGGEFGEAWHQAGTKLDKQNVFDDFIAAAEYLVAQRYTKPAKLGIGGRSNGGLLVGAVLTQRPDLFGAALPGVGVLDMLRFDKFTIGWAWTSDYGSTANPDEFAALLAYSPYHNVRMGTQYPPTLVYTADHDDRVVPLHSYKFTAALQYAQGGRAPVLIRVDTKSGHGAGKPTRKQIEEWADLWSFLVFHLRMELP
ncbi:MAG: S9 family peptidase [Deltaproteobacteria bacterium]|nr:S9 family peptidase [Deltaproteobacteria bacterium]MBK8719504.1 S9 family peptidase [Deltaproteobacteria bacterium]MBP7287538.1 S9 family peptidase [Nannocystaceae bacterium]